MIGQLTQGHIAQRSLVGIVGLQLGQRRLVTVVFLASLLRLHLRRGEQFVDLILAISQPHSGDDRQYCNDGDSRSGDALAVALDPLHAFAHSRVGARGNRLVFEVGLQVIAQLLGEDVAVRRLVGHRLLANGL